jgi:hypothetical protein
VTLEMAGWFPLIARSLRDGDPALPYFGLVYDESIGPALTLRYIDWT